MAKAKQTYGAEQIQELGFPEAIGRQRARG
jgi:hypothetical protein